MRSVSSILALAAAASLSMATAAQAAITTVDYTFGPAGAGQGTMTLNYDTATSAYSLAALNFWIVNSDNYGTADVFFNPYIGGYALYGRLSGIDLGSPYLGSDFIFVFDPDLGTQIANISWTTQGDGTGPSMSIVTINRVGGGVPEPSTWALMLLGFGIMGIALRRRGAWRSAHFSDDHSGHGVTFRQEVRLSDQRILYRLPDRSQR